MVAVTVLGFVSVSGRRIVCPPFVSAMRANCRPAFLYSDGIVSVSVPFFRVISGCLFLFSRLNSKASDQPLGVAAAKTAFAAAPCS